MGKKIIKCTDLQVKTYFIAYFYFILFYFILNIHYGSLVTLVIWGKVHKYYIQNISNVFEENNLPCKKTIVKTV